MDSRELCIDELGKVNGGFITNPVISTPIKTFQSQGGVHNAAMTDVDPYMRSAPARTGRPAYDSNTGVDPYMRSIR